MTSEEIEKRKAEIYDLLVERGNVLKLSQEVQKQFAKQADQLAETAKQKEIALNEALQGK